jgi:hypothetical protein
LLLLQFDDLHGRLKGMNKDRNYFIHSFWQRTGNIIHSFKVIRDPSDEGELIETRQIRLSHIRRVADDAENLSNDVFNFCWNMTIRMKLDERYAEITGENFISLTDAAKKKIRELYEEEKKSEVENYKKTRKAP